MRLADGTHLSYCTNIHAGDGWTDAFAALRKHVPAVRDALAERPADGFGLGLRLSHASLIELERDEELAAFRAWLDNNDCYVFTINGFPYGRFHGETVKADVYRPDWTEPARLDYTCRLATLATRLVAPGQRVTISTLPGTFKAWSEGAEPAIAAALLETVAHCVTLERDSGVEVSIAIEPEPCCLLETAEEVCDFFAAWLHTDAAAAYLARLASLPVPAAGEAISRHLGVCHDVCHSAVEFEDALGAPRRYAAAGIRVLKLQLSSALQLAPATVDARAALSAFDEPVYLHQVVRRLADGTLRRHPDLGEALALARSDDEEWRVHFHVPVFLERLERFGTTQSVLAELLDAHAREPIAQHLEVETYTWDVLPVALRDVPIERAIARELDWVHDRLDAARNSGQGDMAALSDRAA